MGFFSKLVGSAVGAKDAAMAEVSKLQRQDDCIAMLAIMALVAGADNEVEKEESAMAIDFVKNGDVFKGFDRSMLATRLESNFKKCVNPIMRDDLIDDIRGIADEPDTARKVLRAGIAIASSDGEFEPEEKEVLLEVCQVLKLNPADFKQLR